MLFYCLHQHYKARSNRRNVPFASELGNRIDEVPARKMSLGGTVLAVIQQLSLLAMDRVFLIVWFLKHITLVSSLD